MRKGTILLAAALALEPAACNRSGPAGAPSAPSPRRWVRLGDATLAEERVLDLAVGPDGRLFAGCATGILRSLDGGETWEKTLTVSGANEQRVRVDAMGRIYVGEMTGGGTAARVRVSTDGGATWAATPWDDGRGARASVVTGFAFLPSDGVIASGGFFGDLGAMFLRSADGGATWAPNATAARGALPRAATSVHAGPTGILVAGTEGLGNFVSTDEGRTWTRSDLHDGQQTIALAHDSAGRFYAAAQGRRGADNAIWVSTPDGLRWTELGLGLGSRPNSIAVKPAPAAPADARGLRDAVFVGTASEGIFASEDAGASWAPMVDGLPADYRETAVNAVVVDAKGYVYAALTAANGHAGGIFRTEQPWR
jgi:photosystem II stability/assembly factor-like uncharacterized protein